MKSGLLISKRQFCLSFLDDLISNQSFKPFIDFDDTQLGFYDFQFITKFQARSLISLREEVKIKKSFTFQWFNTEARKIFKQVSDYVLLSDPLQQICSLGFSRIRQFQKKIQQQFDMKKSNKQKPSKDSQSLKMLNITKQLQMIYYLKSYEYDEQIIRKIGQLCQILQETEEQFIIDFSSSRIWQSIIQKTDN